MSNLVWLGVIGVGGTVVWLNSWMRRRIERKVWVSTVEEMRGFEIIEKYSMEYSNGCLDEYECPDCGHKGSVDVQDYGALVVMYCDCCGYMLNGDEGDAKYDPMYISSWYVDTKPVGPPNVEVSEKEIQPWDRIEYNEDYMDVFLCTDCGYEGRVKVKESFDFASFFCAKCENII